jgi:hypothetical protein
MTGGRSANDWKPITGVLEGCKGYLKHGYFSMIGKESMIGKSIRLQV